MSFFGNRLKHVVCKTWDATQPGSGFPELDDPEYQDEELKARPNVGIAVSGGGTRSASCALGHLRALKALGLIKKIRYISCVSGGAWACTPFTYLPNNWTDKTFLGQVIPPEDITMDYLLRTDRNSLAHTVANSILLDDIFKNAARFAGDETYSRAIGDIFLKPFEIDSLERFFSLNQKTVATIVERNRSQNIDMTATDFYRVRSGRPYLIVNSIILRITNKPPLPKRIHFESTPLYVGCRVLHEGAGSNGQDIGGGYVEPFGFDSDAPGDAPDQDRKVDVRLGAFRHRYTLADVIGASGAAPAEVLAERGLNWLGFPEFKYWCPVELRHTQAKEYTFGDGGILENLGLMPLLMRKVERIVVFVNTQHELEGGNLGEINDSIPPLFGLTSPFEVNHVFPKAKYAPLVDGLMAAKDAGKTVMFQDRYPVLENRFYGIEGDWEVDVLWVYNERVPAWEENLAPEIRRQISVGSLSNFPHYRTVFQNPPAIIDLSAKQVNMLASLSGWNVTENKDVFQAMLS